MRIDILKMLHGSGSGHTGGSLSATDIMAALYFYKMRYDPKRPDWSGRDHFILSKGHAAPVLYTTLAHAGFLETSELCTLRKLGSRHPLGRRAYRHSRLRNRLIWKFPFSRNRRNYPRRSIR